MWLFFEGDCWQASKPLYLPLLATSQRNTWSKVERCANDKWALCSYSSMKTRKIGPSIFPSWDFLLIFKKIEMLELLFWLVSFDKIFFQSLWLPIRNVINFLVLSFSGNKVDFPRCLFLFLGDDWWFYHGALLSAMVSFLGVTVLQCPHRGCRRGRTTKVREWFKPHRPHDTNTCSDVDLLDFVFRSTCFQYNGSIYKQLEVAAMGSPQ